VPDEGDDVPPWRAAPTEDTAAPERALPAGEFPAPPDEDTASRPRLAAEMVTDTSRDVIVAGKKKTEPSSDDSAPVRPARTRKKPPKSDS
jgi:hypothetical protein